MITVLVLSLAIAGCPRAKRRTLVPDVPTSGDDQARARFQEARVHFERDGERDAAEFTAIAEEYPDDPIATYALLYAGMSAFENGEYQAAAEKLQALDEEPDVDRGMRLRGRLFLGMAETHLGRYDLAAKHLAESQRALEGEEEKARYLAYLAEARGHSAEPLTSLTTYDRWFRQASEPEKAYILARLQAIASQATAIDAARAYRPLDPSNSPAAVVLGLRVLADLHAEGDVERALAIERAIEPQRAALGLEPVRASAGHGAPDDPSRMAAVLPVTGKRARLGESALRGLSLAAGTFVGARGNDVQPFHLSVRDTNSTAEGALGGVEAVAVDGAIAAVGPIDRKTVETVAPLARTHRLPLISLNVRSGRLTGERSAFFFHIQRSAEDRAESLARRALTKDVKKVAILRPDNGYGRAVGQAFRAELEKGGGTVVKEVTYETKTTSFGSVVRKLGKSYQAIFIPDQARRLALIAPALAAADLEVRALGALERAKKRARRRRSDPTRPIGLLSTAELVDARFLRSAGRYCRGAVFAPGFYPDREDPLIRDFVERYEIAYGTLPRPLDAHAYDAARIVRTAVENGARTRAAVARALSDIELEGLTGTIAFDDDHKRADDGLLFQVVRDGAEYKIRSMR